MLEARTLKAGLLLVAFPLVAVVTPPQSSTVFHSGTRLVELEVVVRGKPAPPSGFRENLKSILDSGPPFGPPGAVVTGLTKDSFQVFDNGQPQPISVFRAGPSTRDAKPVTLPPGAVSNRLDSRGQPLNGATAVLIDLLNTEFDLSDYARNGMKGLLRSLAETDTRLGVYSLGQNLHVLQDFNDDPKKLMEAAAKLSGPRRDLPPDLAKALADIGDRLDPGTLQARPQTTINALKLIVQHLSGVPGRKNLVWLLDINLVPRNVRDNAVAMMQQANVILYPVAVRSVGPQETAFNPDGGVLATERKAQDLGAATGGRAFFDAMDFAVAVHAAEEDSHTSYVLGFYPYENQLDGKYHNLVVKLKDSKLAQNYEVHYRTGYLASKVALPAPTPTAQELYEGPVDSLGIGLSAQAMPDADHPGLYQVNVTVDLHDIHLESSGGRFTGKFDLSIPNPSASHTVHTTTVSVDLQPEQLAQALENGLSGSISGVEPSKAEIRVVVIDRATGAVGSVRLPIGAPAGK